MVTLARVLDGLQVVVQPPLVVDVRCREPAGAPAGPPVGAAVLELRGGACIRLSRHAVTVVPSAAWPAPAAGGRDLVVAQGRIRATYRGAVDLFQRLERPLTARLRPGDPLAASCAAVLDEMTGQQPGARAMVEALLRRCLILLLRREGGEESGRLAWLAPLADARLHRALDSMQAGPEQAFTLPRLAEVAGMSRSVFAARFSTTLGRPPMEFLKSIRLTRAAQLLTGTDLPVKSIAARVGYASRSSFTRAFIVCHGVGPTAFRAAAREPIAVPRAAAA